MTAPRIYTRRHEWRYYLVGLAEFAVLTIATGAIVLLVGLLAS